ncbi:MAG: nitrite reductase (NAD(P)H) small subunit [Gemmatimonadetes bacterium]|nr:nitrite reductase (NAD(P)H) small subunit [Gemmatimonadota bacterium]
MSFVEVIELSRCRKGGGTFVEHDGRELAVFRAADSDEVYVIDNACPHSSGNLSAGELDGAIVCCPLHHWKFDLTTGCCTDTPRAAVTCYPVEVREDGIYVGFAEESARPRSVSDVIVETMINWGIRHVWGMVGHSNLGLADAMRRQEAAGSLSYYGIRHEGAAAFAASAYGKLTGRPAACFSIAGPGATNLLTGLWDANVDRSPVLALTGQVDSQVLGPGAFQEVDLMAAYGKVAQWAQPVLPTSKHAELANLACKSAILNRGVSHLVFPDDVQALPVDPGAKAGGPEGRLTARTISPPAEAVDKALELLESSKRPTIIVGHGARFHMEGVVALAETLRCPVVTTFKAKGLISDHHPLGCGVLGRSGTPIASWFMNESDLLLVLGASFSNHTGITSKKPTIQVDFDPMILGKFHAVDVPVWGEIGVTTEILRQRLQGKTRSVDRTEEIAERWAIWRTEKKRRRDEDRGMGLNSATIFDALSRAVPEDAILAVDVGNNTYSFGRYFESRRQSVLMSGYLGSIGFALPAALGAWAATQEDDPLFQGRKVVSISGDGGFGQYMAEMTTLVKYDMNITHILLSNDELGKISKEQRSAEWEVWQTSLVNPDFAAYAELCGALGIRVEDASELPEALERALAHDGPSLVEIRSDAELI